MSKLLWEPSEERIRNSNMKKFIDFVNKRHDKNFEDFFELYDWSVTDIPDFWEAMWDFGEVISSKKFESVVDDLNKFPGANWFGWKSVWRPWWPNWCLTAIPKRSSNVFG